MGKVGGSSASGSGDEVCDQCDRRFKMRKDLLRHQMTHTGVKPYVCCKTWCNAAFPTAYGLTRHAKKVHKTNSEIVKQQVKAAGAKHLEKMGVAGVASIPGKKISSTIRNVVLGETTNGRIMTAPPNQKSMTDFFTPKNSTSSTSTAASSNQETTQK